MISARLWSTGLINQLMSLEIIVGLSEILGKPVSLYNMKDQFDSLGIWNPIVTINKSRYKNFISDIRVQRISDILDWENSEWILEDKDFDFSQRINTISLFEYQYINCSVSRQEGEDDFRNDQKGLVLNSGIDYNFVDILAFYSRFFFNRTREIDIALSKICWKRPYIELASDIARELGDFVSIHLRDTDNHRIFKVPESGFVSGLNSLEERGLPIILSTDNVDGAMIQKYRNRYTIIDDIIRFNWRDRFKSLPYYDEIILGLISNLVLGYSKDFIGTPGSTYTGYIHRQINSRENCSWRFLPGRVQPEQNQFNQEITGSKGRYSWCEYKTQPNWWREWPESRLEI